MKLLTQTLKKEIPALYETESTVLEEKEAIVKFFNPMGTGTWYVIEGEEQDGDFLFFGLVELYEQEFGYFSLKELESISLPFGLKIERDINFEKTKMQDILK
jgi:hypothetical protein